MHMNAYLIIDRTVCHITSFKRSKSLYCRKMSDYQTFLFFQVLWPVKVEGLARMQKNTVVLIPTSSRKAKHFLHITEMVI